VINAQELRRRMPDVYDAIALAKGCLLARRSRTERELRAKLATCRAMEKLFSAMTELQRVAVGLEAADGRVFKADVLDENDSGWAARLLDRLTMSWAKMGVDA